MAPGQRTGIATMDADLARCSANVSSWHETDMPTTLRDVRFQGQSGKHLLALSFSGFDPQRTSDGLALTWTASRVGQFEYADSIRAGWSDAFRKGLEISMTHVVTADSLMSADDLNLTLVGRSVAESALLCHSRLGGERP